MRHYDAEQRWASGRSLPSSVLFRDGRTIVLEFLLKMLVFGLFSKAYMSSVGLISSNDRIVK
jgi:hypothetical protein